MKYINLFLTVLLYIILVFSNYKENHLNLKQSEPSEDFLKKQLQVISENASLWLNPIVEGCMYTVTDLGQNGRLELISSYTEGSGLYTTSHYYEVNETLDGLTLCKLADRKSDSEADITMTSVPVYYDSNYNIYYYIFDDTIRDGYQYSYYDKRLISLKEGELFEDILAYKDKENTTITYKNADETQISEEEYNHIADTIFLNYEKGEASFSWFLLDSEDLDSTTSELESILFKSYQGFSLKDIDL